MARIHHRYRCLAAVHSQWHKGSHTLDRCLALLKIFKARANRTAIEQELIAAKHFGSDIWKTKNENNGLPDSNDKTFAPFPFMTTCLAMGTSFDAFKGIQSRAHLVDCGYKFQDYDGDDAYWNDDGLTILDITKPEETRYCFTNLSTEHEGSRCNDDGRGEVIPAKNSLPASSYLSAYFDKSDSQMRAKVRPLIQELEAHEVIDQASFNDLWEDHESDPVVTAPFSTFNHSNDTTAEEFFEGLLQQPSTMTSRLHGVLQDPETRKVLKEKLYEMAQSSASLKGSPAIIELICSILSNEEYVDLSAFRSLSSSESCSIIAILAEQGKLTSLNLSNNVGIVDNDLINISDHLARLQTIYLLGESQVSPETIHSVAKSPHSRLRSVYHSESLRQPFDRKAERSNAEYTRYVEDLACFSSLNSPNSIAGAIWV